MANEEAEIDFYTQVDLEMARSAIRAFYADFIAADRYLPVRMTIYHGSEPTITVTGRAYDTSDPKDKNRCIMEMFYLLAATNPHTVLISFGESVKYSDGYNDSIVITALNKSGALTETCPFVIDENNAVEYLLEKQVDVSTFDTLYDKVISNMMPVFIRLQKIAWPPSELIQFLSDRGHEVEYHGDWKPNSLDPRTYI